ncbi:hypothetical protein ACFP1Z_05395 [Streptomyces gamaensis]|uniref:Uncharacterized protein n=1 Tax=Streptomyces gamaensis TaxID=1763542 RepID=A0ABW0YXS9_9ACTN
MKLVVGDVVRDRTDMALGTVTGVVNHGTDRLVAVRLPGGGQRFIEPRGVAIVARRVEPITTGRKVVAVFALVVGLLAAYFGWQAARDIGADWGLAILAGLGGYTAVVVQYQWWLRVSGPRRFHV